ncbi:MAG TPA: hypothetical protein VI385_09745, partial [Flavisolibacter sp.]
PNNIFRINTIFALASCMLKTSSVAFVMKVGTTFRCFLNGSDGFQPDLPARHYCDYSRSMG